MRGEKSGCEKRRAHGAWALACALAVLALWSWAESGDRWIAEMPPAFEAGFGASQ